jgi:DNA-binding beta-propeller fold protein YncE
MSIDTPIIAVSSNLRIPRICSLLHSRYHALDRTERPKVPSWLVGTSRGRAGYMRRVLLFLDDAKGGIAMRTRSTILISLVVATAACTGRAGVPEAPQRPAAPSLEDVLVLGTLDGTVIVGSSSGAVLSSGEGLVAAPDGSRLYATSRDGGSTILEARDSSTGDVLSTAELDGRLDVRAASLSGRAVALMRPLPAGVDPTYALPRTHTTIVVADPTGDEDMRRFRLTGNFEPEAFSVDDTGLFLIQYLPADAPSSYRVTFLDVADGKVHPVFGRFKTPPERMPGIRLAQVFDPTSEQLYTLYTNRAAEYSDGGWADGSYGGREVSFVHVLNLREGWAYCAGLPRTLWGEPAKAQAMAPSPDGRLLYIVDSMKGRIAEMNTKTLKITRSVPIDLGSFEHGRTTARMSADGNTLFVGVGGSSLTRIDTGTLEVLGRWPLPGDVTGLALSEDGARLYAALGGSVAIVDTDTGDTTGTLAFGQVESILHVTTP